MIKKITSLLWTLGKLLIGTLVFMVATILGGMVAKGIGISLPTMPAGVDQNLLGLFIPVVGVVMAAVQGYFSSHSGVSFLPRWIILFLFSWVAYGLNNYLESKFFMPGMATSYVLLTGFCSCLACSAVMAWLFKPAPPSEAFRSKARVFFLGRPAGSWAWRLLAGLAAFPAAYFLFGRLIAPIVLPYYQQQFAGLALPTQGTMLALSFMRSLFFLLTILPVLVVWKGGRTNLFLALGTALFIMVGGVNMMQAIWLPATLRVVHSLEILADSFVHAAVLVFLLVPGLPVASPVVQKAEAEGV
jgi:hypothetical protein